MNIFSKMHEKRQKRIDGNLMEAGSIWIGEAKRLVAIDTGTLDKSLRVGAITKRQGETAIELGSYGVEYARWVELGNGKNNNYHRNKTIVYAGNGQHFLRRAKENKRGEILTTLKK